MKEIKLLRAAATNLMILLEQFENDIHLAEQGTYKEDLLELNNRLGIVITELRQEYIFLAKSPEWLAIHQMIRTTGGN